MPWEEAGPRERLEAWLRFLVSPGFVLACVAAIALGTWLARQR